MESIVEQMNKEQREAVREYFNPAGKALVEERLWQRPAKNTDKLK